jgi:hypothetical protein
MAMKIRAVRACEARAHLERPPSVLLPCARSARFMHFHLPRNFMHSHLPAHAFTPPSNPRTRPFHVCSAPPGMIKVLRQEFMERLAIHEEAAVKYREQYEVYCLQEQRRAAAEQLRQTPSTCVLPSNK